MESYLNKTHFYSTDIINYYVTNSLNLSTSTIWTVGAGPERSYLSLILLSLSFLGAVLNISIIINLLSMKKSLKTHLKLILSLALSDCIIAAYQFETFLSDDSLVSITLYCLYATCQFAELGTILTIAVDILIKVWKPLRYNILMSKARGNVIITCLWVIPLLLIITAAVFLINRLCVSFGGENINMIYLGFVFFYLLLCNTSLVFFVIIYTIIFCLVRKNMFMEQSNRRQNTSKMAFTFFLIIISYFCCILPVAWAFTIVLLKYPSIRYSQVEQTVYSILMCLYISNTVLDPIIYAVRIPEIRARFRTIGKRILHFPKPFCENTRI